MTKWWNDTETRKLEMRARMLGNALRIGVVLVLGTETMAVTGFAQESADAIWGAPRLQPRAEIIWTQVLCKEPGRYIGWPTVCCRKNGELLAVFSGDRDEHVCPFGKVQMVRSADGGKTWTVAHPTELAGLPPHLLRLRDGTLLSVYGRRFGAFGEYACFSGDGGRTWDVASEIKLAGHFNGDLGYPASAELPDGRILTVYYQAEKKGEKTCLTGTLWKVKKE